MFILSKHNRKNFASNLNPPLLLLIMLMTNNRKIMGGRVNGLWLNILGWITTAVTFAATIGLVVTWFI